MNECIDGWMDGWIDGQTGRQIDRKMDTGASWRVRPLDVNVTHSCPINSVNKQSVFQ